MEQGSQLALSSGAAAGRAAAMAWTGAKRAKQRGDHNPLVREVAWGEGQIFVRATEDARVALKDAVFAAAMAVQHAVRMAEMLDETLAVLEAADGMAVSSRVRETTRLAECLTPREREVLALVAKGRSNKAIAAELYVSPNTVKTHVASLFNKLQAGSRAHLAAIAARQVGISG